MMRTSFDFRLAFILLLVGVGINAVKRDTEAFGSRLLFQGINAAKRATINGGTVVQSQVLSKEIPMCPDQKMLTADSCNLSPDNIRCGNGWGCPLGHTCCLDECKNYKCYSTLKDKHCQPMPWLSIGYSCPHLYERAEVGLFPFIEYCCRTDFTCLLPKDSGPTCRSSPVPQQFYDYGTKQCKMFQYNNCGGGNANRFSTEQQCKTACEACSMSKDEGTCDGNLPRWYYDDNECKIFIYKGCGGNINNFRSKKDCQEYCVR